MHSQKDLDAIPSRALDDGMIYVLAPVHNRRSLTERFARCLTSQTDQRFHLLLIDDGSTDGTAEAVTSILANVTVLRGSGSWWWAGSLQEAHRWLAMRSLTDRDIVLIANDDTRFDVDFLANGRARLAVSPRALLLAVLFSQQSGDFEELGVHVDWGKLTFTGVREEAQVNCFSTRGLFMFARDFVALGGFRPRLLPHYASDYEFTMRARRNGWNLVSDPSVRLWYDPTATGIRQPVRQSLRTYLSTTLSRRSTANPIYLTTFVMLSSPRRFLPMNLFRVWREFARGAASATLGRGQVSDLSV